MNRIPFQRVAFSIALSFGFFLSHPALAQGTSPAKPSASAAELSEGEVRKIDKAGKKITLKHGDIKNLGMPGMTMVFELKEPALLGQLKAGDKVRFRAEQIGSALVVTDIRPAGR